ncbi:MAG: zinc-ribbon and DUF3426 domain-containing protein [Lautropia sp.]
MALATTCPQCKTSFKVIPDQLKLRRGLVRCGVCQHVFSGIDYLRYVDDSSKQAGNRSAASRGGGPQALPARMPESRGGGSRDTRRRPPPSPPASPQTIIAGDEDLKTAFFLADSAFGPYSRTRPEDVHPPTSIRQPEGTLTLPDTARPGTPSPTRATVPTRTLIGDTGIIGPIDGDTDVVAPDVANGGAPAPAPRAAGGTTADELAGPPTRFAPPDPSGRGAHERAARGSRDGGHGTRGTRPTTPPRTASAASNLFPPLDDADEDEDADTRAANRLAREARRARRSSLAPVDPLARRRDTGGLLASALEYFQPPPRRIALITLLVLALLQTLLIHRDEIASGSGFGRSVVTTLAWPFGLSVYPVRDLNQLGIESFDILESGEPDRLVLSAVLVNRGNHTVRWPAMELTLTDPGRAVVVRKVITSAVYLPAGARRDGIGARSEWPIKLTLETRNVQLAGYNVALFYP